MRKPVLSQKELACVRSFAETNMCASAAAKEAHYHRNTFVYHLNRVKEKTGLDPLQFYDLIRLLGISDDPEHISLPERQVVYQEAIEKYGPAAQRQIAIEEMSELTKEICKISRGKLDMEALADEIADVTIMLEQLQLMYGINSEVAEHMDYKVKRLSGRIHGKGDG